MIHQNPLLRGEDRTHRLITMGEIMLRLSPPNYDKIRVANSFEASYGGSEANIAVASSAIKHTIHGDANIIDDVQTIRNLMNMNYDIKR